MALVVEKPSKPTFHGRYRLDRLVVAHDDVTIWEATDAARGMISVQLSIFERGSSVLDQGRSEGGMFVAVDSRSRPAALELAEDEREDDDAVVYEQPKARRRAWPWAVAGLACALTALGGWHVAKGRLHPISENTIGETTITEAQLPATPPTAIATTTPTTPPPEPAVTAPPPPAITTAAPVVAPARRETPASHPKLPAPAKPVKPRPQPANYDPLTI